MAKITLQKVQGNSYYASGIFAVGVYRHGDQAILIDSGSDEQSAKDVLDALQAEGLKISAIVNTHCHPDHCGGNAFFQKRFPEIKIFAAHDEKFFIEDPKWAPRCFCGNATPFAGLKNKHIAPQKPSIVTDVIPYQEGIFDIASQPFTVVPLPGHTPGSIGIITSDNVLYSGDALFGIATLTKHPILLYTDIENTLLSFEKLSSLKVDACVLYHGGLITNLAEIVELHRARVLETKDTILQIARHKQASLDVITQEIMRRYHIPGNIISFTLTQTTVRAYLAKLESEGLISLVVDDGLLQIKV